MYWFWVRIKSNGEAKYIHGIKGKGFFTFYGGHDPEDYQHRVGDPKTELDLTSNISRISTHFK